MRQAWDDGVRLNRVEGGEEKEEKETTIGGWVVGCEAVVVVFHRLALGGCLDGRETVVVVFHYLVLVLRSYLSIVGLDRMLEVLPKSGCGGFCFAGCGVGL